MTYSEDGIGSLDGGYDPVQTIFVSCSKVLGRLIPEAVPVNLMGVPVIGREKRK